MSLQYIAQAANYGSETYGGSTYSCIDASCQMQNNLAAPNTGFLSDSPMVLIPVAIICIVLIVVAVLNIKKLLRKQNKNLSKD